MADEVDEPTTAPSNEPDTAEPAPDPATPAQLTSKRAAADHQYALKNYIAAAELYSEATSIQAELNGEMAPENAELLYAYGRCLYHCGVSKSEVLGGKVAGEKKKEGRGKKRKARDEELEGDAAGAGAEGEEDVAAKVVEKVVEEKDGGESSGKKESDKTDKSSNPFFHITGDDEDWASSGEEDEGDDAEDTGAADEAGAAEEEDEEDDFAIAYEVLDIARILLQRQLEGGTDDDAADKGKAKADPHKDETFRIKERLADTYDLQGEIQLEGERFAAALPDFRSALEMKTELYPEESSLIAEGHYKLSLALEFAAVTTMKDESAPDATKDPAGTGILGGQEQEQQVDEEMRKQAASHMEAAIKSTQLRVRKETDILKSLAEGPKKAAAQKNIDDVKEMIGDMEQRLQDLRGPLVTLGSADSAGASGPAGAPNSMDPLQGILGSVLGESSNERAARIQEATAGANDLTGLVRHRKKPKTADNNATEAEASVNGNGKRRADTQDEASESKRAKVKEGNVS